MPFLWQLMVRDGRRKRSKNMDIMKKNEEQ